MLTTALSMYEATLAGIRKENTSVLPPDEWVQLINEALINWCRDKAKDADFNDKLVDDLEVLMYTLEASPNLAQLPTGYMFDYPTLGVVPVPLKVLSVAFKINYVNNVCGLTGVSDYLMAKRMTADAEHATGYYSKPKDSRLYFMFQGDYVRLYTGTSSTGNTMRMRYIKYPTAINYDPTVTPIIDISGEIRPMQKQEVVDLAVRAFLERVKEERYQSNLNEEVLKQGKK